MRTALTEALCAEQAVALHCPPSPPCLGGTGDHGTGVFVLDLGTDSRYSEASGYAA